MRSRGVEALRLAPAHTGRMAVGSSLLRNSRSPRTPAVESRIGLKWGFGLTPGKLLRLN